MGIFYEEASLWVFIGLTVIIGGGTAWLTGRAIALTWRPVWQIFTYMLLLGFVVRFFHYALFQGTLLSVQYYIVDTLVLMIAASLGFRVTRAGQMASQYPWLYRRTSPFSWSARTAADSTKE